MDQLNPLAGPIANAAVRLLEAEAPRAGGPAQQRGVTPGDRIVLPERLPAFGNAPQGALGRLLFATPTGALPKARADVRHSVVFYLRPKAGVTSAQVKERMRDVGFAALRQHQLDLGRPEVTALFEDNDAKVLAANLTRTPLGMGLLSAAAGVEPPAPFRHELGAPLSVVVQVDFASAPLPVHLEGLRALKRTFGKFAEVQLSRSQQYNVLGDGTFDPVAPRLAFLVAWRPGVPRTYTQSYWREVHAPAAAAMIPSFGVQRYSIVQTAVGSQDALFDEGVQGICYENLPAPEDFSLAKAFRVSNSLALDEARLCETAYALRLQPESWRSAPSPAGERAAARELALAAG